MPISIQYIELVEVHLRCDSCTKTAGFRVHDKKDVILGCDDIQWRSIDSKYYCPSCIVAYVKERERRKRDNG